APRRGAAARPPRLPQLRRRARGPDRTPRAARPPAAGRARLSGGSGALGDRRYLQGLFDRILREVMRLIAIVLFALAVTGATLPPSRGPANAGHERPGRVT